MKPVLSLFALVLTCLPLSAELIYHVAPDGSDAGDGSINAPFATLEKARDTIRALPAGQRRQNIRVFLRGGIHQLREAFVLNVEDGAPIGLTVSYEGFPGETAILDSGVAITGWTKADTYPEGTPEVAKGNLYVADIPEGVERFYSLWDEHDLIDRARAGFQTDPKLPMSQDGVRTRWMELDLLRFKEGPFREWHNIDDIEIYKKPTRNWVANFLQLESVDLENKTARTSVEGTYKLSDNPTRKRAKDIEKEMVDEGGQLCNVPEGLVRPGTWIADTVKGKVYLWPKCEDQLKQRIVAPTLAEYIRIDGENDEWGDNDVPVQGIVISNLTFKHGKRLVLRKDSRGIQHDWEMFDEGNAFVRLRGAENCVVRDCRFLNSAGSGLRLDLYSQNNRIEGNQLDNLGYTGILLCGYGPGTKDVNKNNLITNNEISRVGRLWFHALSIFVFQSGHNVISHNYIHDTMYDAIVVSGVRPRFFGYRFKDFPDFPNAYPDLREIMRIMRWEEIGGKPATFKGCLDFAHSRGNMIEYNEINNAMGEGGDGNALYLSGTISNTFRYNMVHSTAAGPGIFRNDDEQYESMFYGNILIGVAPGPYSGANLKHENAFENNMILNWGSDGIGKVTSLDPEHEKDSKGTRVSRNILYHPGGNTKFIGKIDVHYGDNNTFYAAGDPDGSAGWLKRRQAKGHDLNSAAADPMFVDLENFDFTLKADSPALARGFEQIPFERIGLLSKPAVQRLREEGKTFSQLIVK
jgi:hypothetical protein